MGKNSVLVTDENGYVHILKGKCIGAGGEGEIYEIENEPDVVAKIYYPKYRTQDRQEKIRAMLETDYRLLPEYSWPICMLFIDSNFCGFMMTKLSGYEQLIDFYVFDNRRKYSWAKYVAVAMNIAAVVGTLHEHGLIIGDLKPENILVNTSDCKVAFVDTDSYDIKTASGKLYPCLVATPEFAAPELQGLDTLSSGNRSVFSTNTDCFCLAVILFRLLMNGVHPFACSSTSLSVSEYQPVSNIKNYRCAFFKETSLDGRLERTIQAPDINILPSKIQLLFKKAFLSKDNRPDAASWYYALLDLRKNLCRCAVNHRHEFYSHLDRCPWCSFESSYISKLKQIKSDIKQNEIKEKRRDGDFKEYLKQFGKNSVSNQSTNNTVQSSSSNLSGSYYYDTDNKGKIAYYIAWIVVIIIIIIWLFLS